MFASRWTDVGISPSFGVPWLFLPSFKSNVRFGGDIVEKLSVDIQNLPARFSELLAQTQPGHEIIVTEGGQPKAILTPLVLSEPQPMREITVTFLGQPRTILVPAENPATKRRTPGLGMGTMTMLPGFDDPLPDEFWLGEL